jgi:hypothetical protein
MMDVARREDKSATAQFGRWPDCGAWLGEPDALHWALFCSRVMGRAADDRGRRSLSLAES